jgi:hypothetical protein
MIQEGLLWFDDSPTRPVSDKIERAVQRYQQKYGRNPDVCYVHESEIRTQLQEGGLSLAQDVKVLPTKSMLPHHFWLGIQSPPAKGHIHASQPSADQPRPRRRR